MDLWLRSLRCRYVFSGAVLLGTMSYMQISITPDLERIIREKLASGSYASEEEVLQAALKALDAEEVSVAAIAEGYADFQAGRYRSFDEADAEFRQRKGLSGSP